MKKLLKFSVILLCMSVMFAAAGCEKSSNEKKEYTVYYTNSSANKLVEKQYKTDTDDSLKLMKELIQEMNTRQKQEECKVIKPEHVRVDHIMLNQQTKTADIYFSKEYYDCESSTRLLLDAAVVKMLTQIEGVDYVQFFVDGSEAKYPDGTMLGLLSEEDFVDDSNEAVGSVEWKTLTLYYTDKLGDKLIETTVSVAYNKNVSLEKEVVEKLIKGPSDTSLYATLPPDIKLLNVSVSNKVCYVNFNSAFLTEMINVSNEIPIYSIVNSLCELDTVDSVKIMVNGDSSRTFRESISLENTFTFNWEIVSRE